MKTRFAAALLSFIPLIASSQDLDGPMCKDSIPRMRDGIVFYDRTSLLYQKLDSTFTIGSASEVKKLTAAQQESFEALRQRVDSTFNGISRVRSSGAAVRAMWKDLGKYEAYVQAAFGGQPPPQVNERLCPIRSAHLAFVQFDTEEHIRKLDVKYGEKSERLNILEMILSEAFTSQAPMGRFRDPVPWEPILRTQVLGYQYHRGTRELEASFPIAQLGVTRYLYSSNAIARALHHVGLAAAYERDVKRRSNMVGAILSVQQFDVGVLCSPGCREHVIVASKNVSLFEPAWTAMRRKVVRP